MQKITNQLLGKYFRTGTLEKHYSYKELPAKINCKYEKHTSQWICCEFYTESLGVYMLCM